MTMIKTPQTHEYSGMIRQWLLPKQKRPHQPLGGQLNIFQKTLRVYLP